jgi:transposase
MRQKSNSHELSSERIVKGIRLGDASVTPPKKDPHRAGRPSRRALDRRALPPRTHCRGLYYSGSKKFLEAGKPAHGRQTRATTSDQVEDLRRHARELKEVVAEQALELRLLKKSMIADGGDEA